MIAITFTMEATMVDGIERLRRKMHEENQQTIHDVFEIQVPQPVNTATTEKSKTSESLPRSRFV